MNTAWQKEKAAGVNSSDLRQCRGSPLRDNLRNFLLTQPAEMLSVLQRLGEAL